MSQTTDLAIVVEAQDLNGAPISQVPIYTAFQYVITIINSGNTVSNATFNLDFEDALVVSNYTSQNENGGASDVSNFDLETGNLLSGTIIIMPNNSSVEVLINVNAPTFLGGIVANANIYPPENTVDINVSNNQSVISIDVIDVDIDFTVIHSQIDPLEGTPINAWNDLVTYEFTITNNSSIDFPLAAVKGVLDLNTPYENGRPVAQFISLECIGSTNGTDCPSIGNIPSIPIEINSAQDVFLFNAGHVFTPNGSVTFRVVYQFIEPVCGIEPGLPLSVDSHISLIINHPNLSSNDSNHVQTELLTAELCLLTDICIETVQISPDISVLVDWEEEVVFETTVCNNGPLDAPIVFFLQNLTVNVNWQVISVDCIAATGAISCDDVSLTSNEFLWTSSTFVLPVGATITIQSVVIFLEPECSNTTSNINAHIRSGTNILTSEILDSNIINSVDSDYLTLPSSVICPSSDLQITKTQISPALPEGGSFDNTTSWGPITYEITATNLGDTETIIALSDYTTTPGTLNAIACVSTTGTASCFDIVHESIGIPQDGVPQDGNYDIFWEILHEDNWFLPANSSVTFHAEISWELECSTNSITATNFVSIEHVLPIIDSNQINNQAQVTTYFAPCIDLIVQTFPEFTQVTINQNFDWIIDISNSITSSDATNVVFEDTFNSVFVTNGLATCEILTGAADCISDFNVQNNTISGIIPYMEAGATLRIRIPVTAPSFGGAFNNIAEAIPNAINNEELTPETNLSISNIQVIAPILAKSFNPDMIVSGYESELTFTITNVASNISQSNISFIDNLPNGVIISGPVNWVQDNGCSATFIGDVGGISVGVSNLTIPEGVSSCTFGVPVTSSTVGEYLNDHSNFSDQNNIDTTQVQALLSVIEDTSNVDIQVLKTVFPDEASIGNEVTFTITATNLGATTAALIEIIENLPSGYQYISSITSEGTYDPLTFVWNIASLNPNQSAQLFITARILHFDNLLNIATLSSVFQPDRDESNNEDSAEVVINNCLEIPKGISPNNDGINDFLMIPCIEKYPNNSIKIFNRLGVQIYQNEDYKNNWDGKPNMGFPETDKLLPVGTYYYILEINDLPNPVIGWVYLNY